MAISSSKKGIFCISLLCMISTTVFGQDLQDTDFRRLSLSVTGGATLGDANRNFHFMSSNFTGNIQDTPTFGAGVQYALTPAWSLEAGYRRVVIKGVAEQFETNMNLLTLKNIFNLNQILFINDISTRLNPFLTVGIGYDFFNYNSPGESFTAHNTSYNAGAGIAFRLSNTLDLFSHYEYHLGSNEIDNAVDGWGADLINSLTAGVRINFGKKNAIHPTWRVVPVSLERSEYNQFLTQADQITDLHRQIDLLSREHQEKESRYVAMIDSLQRLLNQQDLSDKNVQPSLANTQCIEVQEEPEFTESLPAGHYVQVFATKHPVVANYIRGHTIRSLKEALGNSDMEVLIFHRKYFYEVMISRFETVAEARDVREIILPVHPDAFVITFPRPVNLSPDFKRPEMLHVEKSD